MSIKVAINGFGRIGRCTLRAIYEQGLQNEFEVVAINIDTRDPDQWRSAAELARKASACGLQVFPMVADMAHAAGVHTVPRFTATRL